MDSSARDRGQPQGLPRDGGRRRQDLPDAPGGPGRGRGRAGTSWSATWSRTAATRPSRRRATSSSCPGGGFPTAKRCWRRWTCRRSFAALRSSALIDELAHTNAPGLEHEKRYEDVEDVLDAGIDVYSTVNVQHLESLNDSVCELTGVRVRETMPDAVLNEADEVVLMDLTPEALLTRLRAGKIYPAERIDSALNNFFRDREPCRPARGRSAPGRRGGRVQAPGAGRPSGSARTGWLRAPATQAVGERLLALIKPTPRAQRLVRRAWRSAQRLGAELDLLWVKRPGHRPTEEEQDQLDAIGRLACGTRCPPAGRGGRRRRRRPSRRSPRRRAAPIVLIGTPSPRTGLDRFRLAAADQADRGPAWSRPAGSRGPRPSR